MRPNRIYSQKSQASELNKSHIVENHLDRKSQLINKYQTETNDLLEQIQSKQPYRKAPILNTDKSARKRALSSLRKDTGEQEANFVAGGSLRDYNKLILGLEYALQAQRKKNQQMSQKNTSLQSQISNLRNLLLGPDQQKHYQKTAFKESQDKIQYLQSRIIQQKKNYQFIIDSKNQTLTTLQLQLRTLKKSFETTNNDQALSRRILDLIAEMDQLKNLVTKKNIQIQRLKYQGVKDEDSDDEEVVKIRKMERLKFYLEQFQISNKLIMKKNVQILGLANKIMSYEKVLDVVELYLDKKEVKGVDLNVLEHPCVNKLRILLRQKAVFQKQLLNQLNDHNKKIATFQSQITGRQRNSSQKIGQVITDNKRLASTVANLQSTISNLERQLQNSRKQNEILSTEITIKKREFIQQVTKLKDQIGVISNVTKNQFDRMKIENLKLSEQNRSLLFLVGEKQREIHKKGEAIKTFEEYREKINTLNVGDKEKRKIETVSEDNTQVGAKLLMLNDFPTWLMEWKKIKNWVNKKTLLNLIIDKEEIRGSALTQMNQLANSVINQCLLQSKNVQIQERGTILTSHFLNHNILQNPRLALHSLIPIFIRGFRPIIEGEDEVKCRILNESALKIISQLSKTKRKQAIQQIGQKQSRIISQSPRKQTYKQANRDYKWTYQMTNEMLAVNGLKYLFNTIRTAQVDELVESAYNILIFIVKNNQMISFMMSFDLNALILNNLNSDYHFIIYLLMLVKCLIQSNDFLKLQNNVLEFRKLFDVVASDEDQELLELGLQCILGLMEKANLFTKSLDKIKCLSILATILRKSNEECTEELLKYCGQVYINIVTEMESQNINKFTKTQIDKLLQVIKLKKFHQYRFTRILRLLTQLVTIVQDATDLDQKIFTGVVRLYQNYQLLDTDMRIKLNQLINTLFQRNKQLLNRYSNEALISNFVQSYKSADNLQEKLFLLKIINFQAEQKRTTELLRAGRESMLVKFVADSVKADYNVAIAALKALLMLAKEKYSEKFVNQALVKDIVNGVLNSRGEEEYIGLALSILYFLCKAETTSVMALEAGIVQQVCDVIAVRHQKQQLVFKSLAVLQVCHTQNYKRRILNYLISSDSGLKILQKLNFTLRKAKNKIEMGTRAVFLYDYFNNPNCVQTLASTTQKNQWVIEDLILLRNQYIGKVDGIVYKIQLLLHAMSVKSNKCKKLYEGYRVGGADSAEEDDD